MGGRGIEKALGYFLSENNVWRGLERFGEVWGGLETGKVVLGRVGDVWGVEVWRGSGRFGEVWRGLENKGLESFGEVWGGLESGKVVFRTGRVVLESFGEFGRI